MDKRAASKVSLVPSERSRECICVYVYIVLVYVDDNEDDVEENYRSMEMVPPRDVYIRLDKFTRSP